MINKEQRDLEIIKLYLEGKSSREIAEAVLGKDSLKSTVNNVINRLELRTKAKEEVENLISPNLQQKEDDWKIPEDELEVLATSQDYDVSNLAKRLRTAQRTNNQLRKINNNNVDPLFQINEVVAGIQKAIADISLDKSSNTSIELKPKGYTDIKDATVEILFSDFQIGKIGQHYNSKLAEKAIIRYGQEVLHNLQRYSDEYEYERIVFAMLGDTVEDHLKHGVQSATSTDSGLAEQIALATKLIWKHVLKPLAQLGLPMEVICIAGNHGSSQHKGMDMYKAGLFSYDYPIYKALELLTSESGYKDVKFVIPEGVFGYTSIYGSWAVYEHGYFNNSTEKSMEDQMKKRGQQMKRHVEYFRCGDMHHTCTYDCGRMVLNGAFFGADTDGVEYSGILGFNSTPSQVMMIHKDERSLGRNTVKEMITMQVADGY